MQQSNPEPDLPLPRSVLIRPAKPALSNIRTSNPFHGQRAKAAVDGVRSASWDVSDDDVGPIPPFLPLERTHVVVDDTPCRVIAGRIAESLRTESIAARFNEKASAFAETADRVRFIVRLFRDSENYGRIIVEVQRRSGCGIEFHNACGAVLRAAQGLPAKKTKQNRPLPPLPLLCASEGSAEEIDEALELAGGLLKKDRLDAKTLGMESLRMITDAKYSGHGKALCASRKILAQEGDVLETIVSLVKFWKFHEEDDFNAEGSFRYEIVRNHAVSVLANSVALLAQARGLGVAWDWAQDDGLLSALVQDLKDAETRPHDSYQAARCLNVLLQASDGIRTRSLELGVEMASQKSFNEGISKHALLASESEDVTRNLKGKVHGECGWGGDLPLSLPISNIHNA